MVFWFNEASTKTSLEGEVKSAQTGKVCYKVNKTVSKKILTGGKV